MIKRRYPIALIVSVYLYISIIAIFTVISGGISVYVLSALAIGHIILTLVIIIPNIVYIIKIRNKEIMAKNLLLWSVITKLSFIPLYVVIYLFGIVAAINPMSWVFVIMFFVFDISLLVPTSLYAVLGLRKAQINGSISSNITIRHSIFQFIFVLDVFSALWMYKKVSKLSTSTTVNIA